MAGGSREGVESDAREREWCRRGRQAGKQASTERQGRRDSEGDMNRYIQR